MQLLALACWLLVLVATPKGASLLKRVLAPSIAARGIFPGRPFGPLKIKPLQYRLRKRAVISFEKDSGIRYHRGQLLVL